eukprot:Gb_20671 [translate_table: standard]
MAGFTVGAIPQLKALIVGASAPLHLIQDSATLLGNATIPSIILILGGNLIKGLRSSKLRPVIVVGVVCVRFILLPAIGICVVKGASYFGMLPADPLYHFVLMIQYTLPPAMNIGCKEHSTSSTMAVGCNTQACDNRRTIFPLRGQRAQGSPSFHFKHNVFTLCMLSSEQNPYVMEIFTKLNVDDAIPCNIGKYSWAAYRIACGHHLTLVQSLLHRATTNTQDYRMLLVPKWVQHTNLVKEILNLMEPNGFSIDRSSRNISGDELRIVGIQITRTSCEEVAKQTFNFVDENWKALTFREMYNPRQFLKTFYQALGRAHLYRSCPYQEGDEAFVPWPQIREGCIMIPLAYPSIVYVDEHDSIDLLDESTHELKNPKFFDLDKDDEKDLKSPSKVEEHDTVGIEEMSQWAPDFTVSFSKGRRLGQTFNKPPKDRPKDSKKMWVWEQEKHAEQESALKKNKPQVQQQWNAPLEE